MSLDVKQRAGPHLQPSKTPLPPPAKEDLRITNTHLLDGNLILGEFSDDSTLSLTIEQLLSLGGARTADRTGETD
jgi:hypothetical protein